MHEIGNHFGKRTIRRAGALFGAGLVAAASVGFTGLTSAHAANGPATDKPFLDAKWNGKSDTNSGAGSGSCDYKEIKQTHSGIGWHFVLPGIPANMSSFTANFATAGSIQVTTTESAQGVIVQGGKGAVIFTSTHDTLTPMASWTDVNGQHAGQGVNSGLNNHYLQLSHICSGATSGSPTPTNSNSKSPTPPSHDPSGHPSSHPSGHPSHTPPTHTTSGDTQVKGIHDVRKPSTDVSGTSADRLPSTGQEIARMLMWVVLLVVAGVLLLSAARVRNAGHRRRH